MTLDEATAALAVDPSLLFLEGCHFDTIANALQGDAVAAMKIAAYRAEIVGKDAAGRLMILRNAKVDLADLASRRDEEQARAAAYTARVKQEAVDRENEWHAQQARSANAYRALHPLFSALKSQLAQFEMDAGGAQKQADLTAAGAAFSAAVADALSTFSTIAKGLAT